MSGSTASITFAGPINLAIRAGGGAGTGDEAPAIREVARAVYDIAPRQSADASPATFDIFGTDDGDTTMTAYGAGFTQSATATTYTPSTGATYILEVSGVIVNRNDGAGGTVTSFPISVFTINGVDIAAMRSFPGEGTDDGMQTRIPFMAVSPPLSAAAAVQVQIRADGGARPLSGTAMIVAREVTVSA